MLRFIIIFGLVCSAAFSGFAKPASIATGSPSGLYYPFGGGLAAIWSRDNDRWQLKAEVTGGSVTNVIQVAKGESALGISQGDALREAIEGTGAYPHPMPVRAYFALYPNVLHLVTKKSSDIHRLADLQGKRLSMGAPGSGTFITSHKILEAMNLSAQDMRLQYLTYSETAEALKNNAIDAGFMVGGLGLSALVELALIDDIRIVPIKDAELETIMQRFPAYFPLEVPGGLYHGVDSPISTISMWNFVFGPASLADKDIEFLIRSAFEHKKELMNITQTTRFMTVKNSLRYGQDILHPEAIRVLEALADIDADHAN